VFLIVTCSNASADRLTDQNATHYGKLVEIQLDRVVFDENCSPDQRMATPVPNLIAIDFDDECQPPRESMRSIPITLPCPGEARTLFTIYFKENGSAAAVEIETAEAQQLRFSAFNAKGVLVGPLQDVKSIVYGSVCLQRLTPAEIPSSFHQAKKKQRKK
jgi:hypothetical protein